MFLRDYLSDLTEIINDYSLTGFNIETWFHYSFGHEDCNEDVDYKSKYIKQDDAARRSAEIFAKDICSKGLPDDAPDSLHKACEELTRLGLGMRIEDKVKGAENRG